MQYDYPHREAIKAPYGGFVDLETKKVLKKCSQANRCLAELKGVSGTIPNQNILINTLFIQEAKDSSEVENIITTHDELFTKKRNESE